MAYKRLDNVSMGRIVQTRELLIEAQSKGQDVFRLESGDPSFGIPKPVELAVHEALSKGHTHYVPNAGIPELRHALATKLQTQNRMEVVPGDVFVTNGAMHALYVLFSALVDEGDEVLIPDPMWTEVRENIKLAGGTPVGVPLSFESEFKYTAERVKAHLTPKTKAIFLNTPHNPTGAVLSKEELSDLCELARENDLWLISDEAYEHILYDGLTHVSPATLVQSGFDKVVSVYSFSKSYAMSGLRLGCCVTKNDLLKSRLGKALRCTINGVSSLSQWAGVAALATPLTWQDEMVEEYTKRRELLVSALGEIEGFNVFRPSGTFYVWVDVAQSLLDELKIKDVDAFGDLLAQNGIGNAPGSAFGEACKTGLRFAFSCETKMVEDGAKALVNLMNTLR